MLFPMNGGGGGATLVESIYIGNATSYTFQKDYTQVIVADASGAQGNFSQYITLYLNGSAVTMSNQNIYERTSCASAVLTDVKTGDVLTMSGQSSKSNFLRIFGYNIIPGGGGTVDPPALVDTTLWTNNSPSSTFAGQIVTLSDDITNYDFIKVEYAYQNGSSPVATDISHAIMTIDDFVATGTSPYGFRGSFLTAHRSNGYVYARTFIYNATNKVQITDSIRYSSSGSVATNNDLPMPLRIIGIKKTSDFSCNDPKVVETHNITSGQTYTFTLDASKEYILSAYSTSAGTNVLYVKNGTYKALVASGSMGSISSISTTSITVYGYAIGGATITWTLTQLN